MPLTECMQKTTARQYRAWMIYLEDELNNPTTHDHYLMKVCETIAIYSGRLKKSAKISADKFKLTFKRKGSAKSDTALAKYDEEGNPILQEMTKEEIEEASAKGKYRWINRLIPFGLKFNQKAGENVDLKSTDKKPSKNKVVKTKTK